MKPYRTLRQLLVHPKDQPTVEQTGECVYRIPCHNCDCTYIGETARNYGKRQELGTQKSRIGKQQNVHTVRSKEQGSRNELVGHNRSCSERKSCHGQVPKCWKEKDIGKPGRSRSRSGSGKNPTAWTEMEGRIHVSLRPTAYDRLLVTCSTSRDHKPDKARRWRAKRRN